MSDALEVGKTFPAFSLPNQDGRAVQLGDFAGQWLVIFVYPKDDTPGCTVESRGFSAASGQFAAANARVVGLSADGVESHKSFCGKFDLRVPLLADTNATLLLASGVGQSDYRGTFYWNRVTFLIDPGGVVRRIYRDVKPQGHEQAVLADLLALSSKEQA